MPGCKFKQQASTFNTIGLNHSFPVSDLPQVLDKISGQLIILDSGACHSFLPATAEDKKNITVLLEIQLSIMALSVKRLMYVLALCHGPFACVMYNMLILAGIF